MLTQARIDESERPLIAYIETINDVETIRRVCEQAGLYVAQAATPKQTTQHEKETPADVEKGLHQTENLPDTPTQQVTLKSGIVLQGAFKKVGDEFRYWRSELQREESPSGYRTLRREDVVGRPVPAESQDPSRVSVEPSLEVRRAVLKGSGKTLEGIFELSGDYYKYWETEQDRRDEPSGYRTVLPQQLRTMPVEIGRREE
jgi:hypothetical protein